MYDKVVIWKDEHGHESVFPAWTRPDGTLVDLTDYEGCFNIQALRKAGVREEVIQAACESKPLGYALIKEPENF